MQVEMLFSCFTGKHSLLANCKHCESTAHPEVASRNTVRITLSTSDFYTSHIAYLASYLLIP